MQIKRALLGMVDYPEGRYLYRYSSEERIRQYVNADTIREVNEAVVVEDRNRISHLESDPTRLLSKLLVLEQNAYERQSSSSRTPPERAALYSMVTTLGLRHFETLIRRIREDGGENLRPINQEQIARITHLLR